MRSRTSLERGVERFLAGSGRRLHDFRQPHVTAEYVIYALAHWSGASLGNRLGAVDGMLARAGLPRMPRQHQLVRDVRAAVVKVCAPRDVPKPAIPLPLEVFIDVGHHACTTEEDAQAWFLCLCIRFALVRPAEVTQLTFADVKLRWPHAVDSDYARRPQAAHAVAIQPFTTKTSAAPWPAVLLVRSDNSMCAVAAFARVLGYASQPAGSPPDDTAAISSLSTSQICDWVRARLPAEYKSHFSLYSLKRVGVTDMVAAGVPDREITATGRWFGGASFEQYYDVPTMAAAASSRLVAAQRDAVGASDRAAAARGGKRQRAGASGPRSRR